jgi:hypothetical protein
MTENKALTVFEDYKIRRIYDKERDRWFFSVVDIIAASPAANGRRRQAEGG